MHGWSLHIFFSPHILESALLRVGFQNTNGYGYIVSKTMKSWNYILCKDMLCEARVRLVSRRYKMNIKHE
jgi:hypothetical protein